MVESSISKPVVLITGVSGYLGSQVALVYLKDGGYTVRGTVRDCANAKKIEPLKKAFGENFNRLTLVEANLDDKDSIIASIKGADYVVHTASPFPLKEPKNENELINPAVNGTLAVMEACKVHKVKRVVITSSIASIMYQRPGARDLNSQYTEQDWSDPLGEHITSYAKSKTLAELAAWDFQKKLPESEKIEIVTINPGFILGPAFVGAGFSSGDLIVNLVNGKYPGLPRISVPVVDVRECAIAHLNAIKIQEAANKRFVLVHSTIWIRDLSVLLYNEFHPQGYSFTTKELPKWLASLGSLFYSELKPVMKDWGVQSNFNNSQSREVLGVQYRPLEQTVSEMVYSMFESGALQDKRKTKKSTTKL